jgi:co-chaperonin GroES (HSP10)
MTKTTQVVVPDHVAQEIEKENQAISENVQETGEQLDKAYVEPGLKVLDPTLLDKSALERMPTPTGWRMLILPFAGMGVSKGGIIMTKDTVDRERLSTVCAYVVKMGSLCYQDAKFGDKPWCQEKQWVLIGRYAGARFKLGDDAECRIINDDEVIATIHDPTDIVAV